MEEHPKKECCQKIKAESDRTSRLPIYRNNTGQDNVLDNTVGVQISKIQTHRYRQDWWLPEGRGFGEEGETGEGD